MRKEIQVTLTQYQFECDNCGLYSAPQDSCRLPDGWSTVELKDCGLTGYTKKIEVCPHCKKFYENDE